MKNNIIQKHFIYSPYGILSEFLDGFKKTTLKMNYYKTRKATLIIYYWFMKFMLTSFLMDRIFNN